eukprot:GHVT01068095.1.p2 GENE.GHVT01068095.1~~GHVT01068095.1.p2  ORF type:complete len:110 (-),score=13.98 GHVT01068095.1:1439-1768(-)
MSVGISREAPKAGVNSIPQVARKRGWRTERPVEDFNEEKQPLFPELCLCRCRKMRKEKQGPVIGAAVGRRGASRAASRESRVYVHLVKSSAPLVFERSVASLAVRWLPN